jgi:hypothetical protein
MNITVRSRLAKRLSFGSTAVLSLLVALMAFAPAVAAGEDSTLIAANSRPLILGDVAGSNLLGGLVNVTGVVWEKRGVSYIRWSTDDHGEGMTFDPTVALRGGLRAKDPRLAACNDYLYAASVWDTAAGDKIGIDWAAPMSGEHARGRYVLAPGTRPDIACMPNGLIAVTYMSGELVRFAIFDGENCGNPCVPIYQDNPGAMPEFGRASVTATDRGFVVAWMGPGIWVQRYVVTMDPGVTVTRKPIVSVGEEAWFPQIAADGARVVLAYQRRGQTHMRISENHGKNFGPKIVVAKFCLDCPEGSSAPNSVDALDGRIMVHVSMGGGIPTAIDHVRFLTSNDGRNWTKTPAGQGGRSFGVLVDGALAEAWGNHVYAGSIYGSQPQEIRFRGLSLP